MYCWIWRAYTGVLVEGYVTLAHSKNSIIHSKDTFVPFQRNIHDPFKGHVWASHSKDMLDGPFKIFTKPTLRHVLVTHPRVAHLAHSKDAQKWPIRRTLVGEKSNNIIGRRIWSKKGQNERMIFKDAYCQVQAWHTGQNCCTAVLKHFPLLTPK